MMLFVDPIEGRMMQQGMRQVKHTILHQHEKKELSKHHGHTGPSVKGNEVLAVKDEEIR